MRPESEFEEYIAAAEGRLSAAASPFAQSLHSTYRQLKSRFEGDLGRGRDLAVSRAGALMLVEALLRGSEEASQHAAAATPLVDELALVVALETLHDGARVWKTIDYSITDRWHQLGWIEEPRRNSKSLVLTAEGLRRAKAARERLMASVPQQQG